ncbi:hypothetical protein RJI07_07805 [Mycoplasmatota bacterium WC30]
MNKFNTNLRDIKIKDFIFVILYGGVISVLLGIVIGLIDFYITQLISFSFSMLLFFFSAQYIGGLVRKQYQFPHIVYTVITGIFLVIQAVIVYALPLIYSWAQEIGDISLIFNISMYIEFVIFFFKSLVLSFNFNYILIILVISVGTYLGIKKTY